MISRCRRQAFAAGKSGDEIKLFLAAVATAASYGAAKQLMEAWFRVTWEDEA